MVQGGYVSQSNSKTLTVSKKSNVLDKIPPRGPKGGASPNNSSASINNNNNNVQQQQSGGGFQYGGLNVSVIILP